MDYITGFNGYDADASRMGISPKKCACIDL